MKHIFILVALVLCVGCNHKGGNSHLLVNSKIVISKGAIESDTIVIKGNGMLDYKHSGLGVKFSGVYIHEDNEIVIKVFDYVRQYDKSKGKKIVKEFTIQLDGSYLSIVKISKSNPMFDAVRLSSKLEFQ